MYEVRDPPESQDGVLRSDHWPFRGFTPFLTTSHLPQAGQWARLRLTLAHINLRRAEHQQQQQQEQQGQHSGGDQGQAQGGAAAGAGGAPPLVVVGYVMKASRERDLAQCGLLGLVPQVGAPRYAELTHTTHALIGGPQPRACLVMLVGGRALRPAGCAVGTAVPQRLSRCCPYPHQPNSCYPSAIRSTFLLLTC